MQGHVAADERRIVENHYEQTRIITALNDKVECVLERLDHIRDHRNLDQFLQTFAAFLMARRSCPDIRAVRLISLHQRFLRQCTSSLRHSHISSSHYSMVFSMSSARALALACGRLLGSPATSKRSERLHSQAVSKFIHATLISYSFTSCHSPLPCDFFSSSSLTSFNFVVQVLFPLYEVV